MLWLPEAKLFSLGRMACLRLADTVMMGTMMVETTTTIDVTFLPVDMVVMMEAGTMMEVTTTIGANFLLADMAVMMEAGIMMEATTTIDANFLPVDMAVMMEAGTVMETMTDANSRVLGLDTLQLLHSFFNYSSRPVFIIYILLNLNERSSVWQQGWISLFF